MKSFVKNYIKQFDNYKEVPVHFIGSIAYYLKDASWVWIVGTAWLVGAFPTHTLFVCIHESAHNLIYKKKSWNVFAGIIANLPSLAPTAISFKNFHLKQLQLLLYK